MSDVTKRVRKYRATSGFIRVEVTVKTPTEATAIRHFAQMLKKPRIGAPADMPLSEAQSCQPDSVAGQWRLTPEARHALDEFGAALDGAPRAIADRAQRMAATLREAAERLRTANDTLTTMVLSDG